MNPKRILSYFIPCIHSQRNESPTFGKLSFSVQGRMHTKENKSNDNHGFSQRNTITKPHPLGNMQPDVLLAIAQKEHIFTVMKDMSYLPSDNIMYKGDLISPDGFEKYNKQVVEKNRIAHIATIKKLDEIDEQFILWKESAVRSPEEIITYWKSNTLKEIVRTFKENGVANCFEKAAGLIEGLGPNFPGTIDIIVYCLPGNLGGHMNVVFNQPKKNGFFPTQFEDFSSDSLIADPWLGRFCTASKFGEEAEYTLIAEWEKSNLVILTPDGDTVSPRDFLQYLLNCPKYSYISSLHDFSDFLTTSSLLKFNR